MKLNKAMIGWIFLLLFIFISCNNDPTGSKDSGKIPALVTENAGLGWQINEIITTGSDIFLMTGGPENDDIDQYSSVPNARIIKERAVSLQNRFYSLQPTYPLLAKPLINDTIIYIEDFNKGEKLVAVYDTDTGIVRLYFVKYKFAALVRLTYDSTEIRIDANYTLNDDSDDRLLDFCRLRLYDADHFLQKLDESVVFTDYVENEPTGIELTGTAYYHERMKLEMRVQFIDINPDGSATLREDFTFDDGKTSYNSITFYANNTGEYEKKLRDDTIISGTFDALEDDLHGIFTQLIDLPAGRFIDKILKSAEISITLPDTIINSLYDELIYFSSGDIDSGHVDIQVQEIDNVIVANFTVQKRNNAHGSFEYREYEDSNTTLTGNWTTWNDYYILLEAEYYDEGSAHIHYEVFAPPYSPGDDPVLVVDYDILPGGTGTGSITYQGEVYQVVFGNFGEATITKGETESKVNLY